jgi:hypothetical protein
VHFNTGATVNRDLFGDEVVPPGHRTPDHATAVAAAVAMRGPGGPLRARVFAAVAAAGERGITDRELERLSVFRALGPSTVRKRRSELYQQGRLVGIGQRDGATIWTLAPGEVGA